MFLIDMLDAYLDTHTHPHVFVSLEGELYRRSNFGRRAMRPSADGTLARKRPNARVSPVKTGLTFHGLRHSHKTYSHVADEVDTRLLAGFADRWAKAVADSPEDPVWRSVVHQR